MMIYVGFLVLKRFFESDQKRIIRYLDFIKTSRIPIWFVFYPEGTRVTEKLRSASWEHSDKRGMAMFNNVLFPRYKGFKLICEQLRNSRIKNVADITFFYLGGKTPPPLWNIFFWDQEGVFKYDIKITPIDEIDDYEEFSL